MKTKMYKTHRCKLLPWVTSVCCMCFLISVPAYGEDEEESIVTDRPDVAESSLTVPSGRVQVETGADLTLTETNLSGTDVSNRNIEFPTKIRVGITPFLELHLESGVATLSKQESNFDALDSELEIDSVPIDIGGKVHLIDLDGWQPSLGILFALTVPTAGDQIPDGLSAGALVAADWDLTSNVGLGSNIGTTVPIGSNTQWEFSYALALGLDLSFLPGMGVYAEGFGVWSDAEHAYAIDGGLAYGLSPTLQFDAYLRTFLHDEVDDIGLGFGASFLFQKRCLDTPEAETILAPGNGDSGRWM